MAPEKPQVENHRWESNRWESVSEDMAEVLRQKTGAERLAVTFKMWQSARMLVASAVRQQYPDWPDHQRQAEIARRMSHGAV